MRGVIVGLFLAAVIAACAGNPPATAPTVLQVDPRKDEITERWSEIRLWRVEMKLAADPLLIQPYYGAIPELRQCRDEREPTTEVCQDTCSLKDAICDNAEKICRIANDLGNDSWAEGKCESAKASCKEATTKCCECTKKESGEAPGAGRSTDHDVF